LLSNKTAAGAAAISGQRTSTRDVVKRGRVMHRSVLVSDLHSDEDEVAMTWILMTRGAKHQQIKAQMMAKMDSNFDC
jgi:ABC-type cobalamin/Fe3+-siderophores transport system ATPase subunit